MNENYFQRNKNGRKTSTPSESFIWEDHKHFSCCSIQSNYLITVDIKKLSNGLLLTVLSEAKQLFSVIIQFIGLMSLRYNLWPFLFKPSGIRLHSYLSYLN